MISDAWKFLPLACLLAAVGGLWLFSSAADGPQQSPRAAPLNLRRPQAPQEYSPPANLRNPFEQESAAAQHERTGGPTRLPGISQELTEQGISLNGIIWDPVQPMAFINGRILPEGGRLGGVKVIRILPDRVILRLAGKTVEKRL
jgi:hypothetical protein